MTAVTKTGSDSHHSDDPVEPLSGRVPRMLRDTTTVIIALLVAHVVLKLVLLSQLAHAPFDGDEMAYVNGGRALSNLVRDLAGLGPVDVVELQRNVVASGWFMPGMSILLAPLFVVDPDASVTAVRVYIGVVTTLLLILAVVSVRKVFGDLYAVVLLVFPGLVPMWLLFSYSAYADLCAGLMIVILLCGLVAVFRDLPRGRPPTLAGGFRLGLIAISVVYLRSSAALLVLAMGSVTVLAVVAMLRGRALGRGLISVGVAAATFVALLLPWATFASATLDGRVVTTTSVSTGLGNTFGARDELCFGPCDPGSTIWFNPLRYSREVARATGLSEMDVADQMSTYARRDVTPSSYAQDVIVNSARYVGFPPGFVRTLRDPGEQGGVIEAFVVVMTCLMYFAALGVTVAMLLRVVRATYSMQVISLLCKLGIGALFAQPLVHISGTRYWTTAAPLMAIALALMLHLRWLRRSPESVHAGSWLRAVDVDAADSVPARVRAALTVAQSGLVAVFVVVTVGILLLAL